MAKLTRARFGLNLWVDVTVKSAKGYARALLPNVHTTAVRAWVRVRGFDRTKGTLTTESKSWASDPKTGVKKALTSSGE